MLKSLVSSLAWPSPSTLSLPDLSVPLEYLSPDNLSCRSLSLYRRRSLSATRCLAHPAILFDPLCPVGLSAAHLSLHLCVSLRPIQREVHGKQTNLTAGHVAPTALVSTNLNLQNLFLSKINLGFVRVDLWCWFGTELISPPLSVSLPPSGEMSPITLHPYGFGGWQ